ncbi:DUF4334 domain-containing protein [Cupriavidus necator]|nr:DUF4334 domain-containing protein [Cupriavidus necator]MDX6008242.1 DUF4334 domain-containing protein [Cupriavidus necator]
MLTEMLRNRVSTTAAVLAAFDELDPLSSDSLVGCWSGFVIATGHPMDGLLSAVGWYGKMFQSVDEAYPLIIRSPDASTLFSIDPSPLPLIGCAKLSPTDMVSRFSTLSPLALSTTVSHGRLRMVEYRGKVTGTLIYDQQPILDHFVMIDSQTVLGIMDFKEFPQPGAFVLQRDDDSAVSVDRGDWSQLAAQRLG